MIRSLKTFFSLLLFAFVTFSFFNTSKVYANSDNKIEINAPEINKIDTIPSIDGLNFFVSYRGSDSNDGKSALTPKLNLNSIESLMANIPNNGSKISLNLEENSLFREEYDPLQNNLYVSSFNLKNPKRLAKITGMDIVKEWNITPANGNTYQHLLNNSIDLFNPGYSFIMIVEIDTALEKTHPVTAVKYLTLAPDIGTCNSTPGTYYTPVVTSHDQMIYMHPSEGVPGKNKFRYEVTTRNYDINGYYIDNATYENLFLQTSSFGYGMLSGGNNTKVKNVIFQGGGVHHTVIKSGIMDSCLFLPGTKGLKDRIAVVFYDAEGTNGYNKISNTIFLNIPNAVLTHTNGVISYKSLVLDNIFAFADTTDAGNGLSTNDTDSASVSNCYVEGYPYGWYGGSTKLKIANSIFRNTNQSAISLFAKTDVVGAVNITNSLIKTNGNDQNQNAANGWTAYGVRSPYNNLNVEVSNTIIHGYSTWHGQYNTITTFQVGGTLKAHNNIYICDVNNDNSMYMNYADNSGGKGSSTNVSSDNNVFILLRGSKFIWTVRPNYNNESSLSSLAEWQSLTGQDKNSIFLDLRDNPLGLKAIFVDPDNGNWNLAQTAQADAVRKISAGMTTPPLFYPIRPAIENSGLPFKTPSGFSTFSGTIKSETESVLQWKTFNESDFSSFMIEYSWDGTHFMEAGSVNSLNDNKNNSYQFVHTHDETDSIYYRLKYFNSDSTRYVSSIIKLKSIFAQEFKIVMYPNPFQQTFTVSHPRRETGEIRIYDYAGRIIKILPVLSRSSKTLVSLANMPSGSYFVQWSSNNEKLSGTVVK